MWQHSWHLECSLSSTSWQSVQKDTLTKSFAFLLESNLASWILSTLPSLHMVHHIAASLKFLDHNSLSYLFICPYIPRDSKCWSCASLLIKQKSINWECSGTFPCSGFKLSQLAWCKKKDLNPNDKFWQIRQN